jgi:predicted MFS family arabinose efflux permease
MQFEKINSGEQESANGHSKKIIEQHDLLMILLLLIILLRSAVWNIFQLIHENNVEWLIAIGIAAFTGKIAGGWLADKIGWRIYALISTFIATPLITVFKNEIILFCIGIGLLQSGIPATTGLLIHSLNGKTARAISLSFGMAVIFGAASFMLPVNSLLQSVPLVLLFSIGLLMLQNLNSKKITEPIA